MQLGAAAAAAAAAAAVAGEAKLHTNNFARPVLIHLGEGMSPLLLLLLLLLFVWSMERVDSE